MATSTSVTLSRFSSDVLVNVFLGKSMGIKERVEVRCSVEGDMDGKGDGVGYGPLIKTVSPLHDLRPSDSL